MPELSSLQQRHDTLLLRWNDGYESEYSYIWLRDNAPEARHRNGQKLIETLQIPLDIKPERVHTQGETLQVQWPGAAAASHYDSHWLRASHDKTDTASLPARHLWYAADLDLSLTRHSLPLCQRSPYALQTMLHRVFSSGFAIIDNIPTHDRALFDVIALFGYVRETNYGRHFDVKVEAKPVNMAFTNHTLSAHTDNPYRNPVPGLQLLHVLENSAAGGENTLVDGWRIATDLQTCDPQAFDILANTAVDFRFQSETVNLHQRTTIIGTDSHGQVDHIRLNNRSMQPINLPAAQTNRFYAAYHQLGTALEHPHHRIQFKLAAGEAMLFDNSRILHGRQAYTGDGNRHLQGCYADLDSLKSKLLMLTQSLQSTDGATA